MKQPDNASVSRLPTLDPTCLFIGIPTVVYAVLLLALDVHADQTVSGAPLCSFFAVNTELSTVSISSQGRSK